MSGKMGGMVRGGFSWAGWLRACALAAGLLIAGGVAAQQTKLSHVNPQSTDQFGQSVAIDGNWAAVGAPFDNRPEVSGLSDAGSVSLFRNSGGWTLHTTLDAFDKAASDEFGTAVDLDGDLLIVGSPKDDDAGSNSGSVYIYRFNGGTLVWDFITKLNAGLQAGASDNFGASVAISGNYAVVGAPLDDDDGSASGSVFVFFNNAGTWGFQAKLTASDAAAGDRFGEAVAMDGDRIVVGARLNDDGGTSAGSAYVFERSGVLWPEQIKLLAATPSSSELFGSSVGIDGDTIVVGVPGDNIYGTTAGSLHVFNFSGGWSLTQVFGMTTPGIGDNLGFSVSIDLPQIVAGAYKSSKTTPAAISSAGVVGVFLLDGGVWQNNQVLQANDAQANDQFGFSVGLSGSTALTGANLEDNSGQNNAGAAYVEDVSSSPLPTPSPTATASPTRSPTASPTRSPSPTPSPTRSPTASPTASASPTPSATPSPTPSASPTASPTPGHTPPPGCGTIAWQDDFESGMANWTATGLWHSTDACESALSGHSSAYSAAFKDPGLACSYENGGVASSGTLTSIVIPVDGSSDYQLSFNYFLGIERNEGFDTYRVLISTDAFATSDVLFDKTVAGSELNLVNTASGWQFATVDITPYVTGETGFQIRFEFDSVDNYDNLLPGWFIDDVTVCNPFGG